MKLYQRDYSVLDTDEQRQLWKARGYANKRRKHGFSPSDMSLFASNGIQFYNNCLKVHLTVKQMPECTPVSVYNFF